MKELLIIMALSSAGMTSTINFNEMASADKSLKQFVKKSLAKNCQILTKKELTLDVTDFEVDVIDQGQPEDYSLTVNVLNGEKELGQIDLVISEDSMEEDGYFLSDLSSTNKRICR